MIITRWDSTFLCKIVPEIHVCGDSHEVVVHDTPTEYLPNTLRTTEIELVLRSAPEKGPNPHNGRPGRSKHVAECQRRARTLRVWNGCRRDHDYSNNWMNS